MFHKEHFCHVSSTNRGCPQYSIYVYKTTDSVETMLSAGYFNGALLDLHKNDVILAGIISDIDDGQYSTAWFRVVKRSLDAVEVEQVLTSADNITYDGTGTNYLSQFDNVQDAISALDAELKKESTERTQGQESLQGQIDDISKDIEALQGAGGALTAYNFNTTTPTQETLTKYAVDQIWPGNTNWAWNAANPAASTFTDANGVARTAAEIFNSTWVNNTYDDHRWQLTNTQNTTPKVFEWADVGRDIVSIATATTAGIVRVGDGSQMVVNASTGDISLDSSKAESIRGTIGAVATNQGTANAGKILGIGDDGNVVPVDGASGAGRNIGDIFWTTRTDSALNGAVEANGAQYNFADVNGGDNNVQALLTSGALPSVSIAKFDEMVAEQGGCDSFGYGTPKMVKIYPAGNQSGQPFIYIELTDEQYSSFYDTMNNCKINEILPYRLYNIDTTELLNGYYLKCLENDTGYFAVFNNEDEKTNFEFYADIGYYVTTEGSKTIPDPDKSQTDPTTYFKVPKKLGRVLVRSQKPTADNDYTWFNIYADGWVEQGKFNNQMTVDVNNTCMLTIPMKDTNYIVLGVYDTGTAALNSYSMIGVGTKTTQSFQMRNEGGWYSWQVEGYADASEYTPDKWDYQNVQVERPMVQLFNGATDEAVAQCTEVLADVAGLKQATDGMIDYVVETQEPTEANGYTWYRKYKSGWVEQGGSVDGGTSVTANFPVEMAGTEYTVSYGNRSGTYEQVRTVTKTTTSITIKNASNAGTVSTDWQLSGMSAQGV